MTWTRRLRRWLWRHPQVATRLQSFGPIGTLVLAFAWWIGDAGRLEPLTLMVAAFSSLAGYLATQLAPPVPQLQSDALQELIAFSDPAQDWERVNKADSTPTIWRYRWDRSLTITEPDDADRPDFAEPWMPASWNGNRSFYVRVRIAGETIFDLRLISIDGGRSVLPYPRSGTDLRITRLQDTIARIVKEINDAHYPYDSYRQEANITITESHELRAEAHD
jgi:hypothetical protein